MGFSSFLSFFSLSFFRSLSLFHSTFSFASFHLSFVLYIFSLVILLSFFLPPPCCMCFVSFLAPFTHSFFILFTFLFSLPLSFFLQFRSSFFPFSGSFLCSCFLSFLLSFRPFFSSFIHKSKIKRTIFLFTHLPLILHLDSPSLHAVTTIFRPFRLSFLHSVFSSFSMVLHVFSFGLSFFLSTPYSLFSFLQPFLFLFTPSIFVPSSLPSSLSFYSSFYSLLLLKLFFPLSPPPISYYYLSFLPSVFLSSGQFHTDRNLSTGQNWTDRPADRQADRQRENGTGRQAVRQRDRQRQRLTLDFQ